MERDVEKELEDCQKQRKALEEREGYLLYELRRLVDSVFYGVRPVRDQVFVSYSREDKTWMARLTTMLAPIVKDNVINVWNDTMIKPGEYWQEKIEEALKRAKVAVLIVSPEFLASEYIQTKQLPLLLDSEKESGARVVWFPVRPSLVDRTPIIHYEAVIEPSSPLNSMNECEQDKALVRIANAIEEAYHG